MTINALMLSASREGNTPYLQHALPLIAPLTQRAKKWVFIPYAGVSLSYDDYLHRVAEALTPLTLDLRSIHNYDDAKTAIRDAEGIIVGGGNTFMLLSKLYQYDLLGLIRESVLEGKPYIGWSAGANITGQSIRTTNDMPIIAPPAFEALGLLPFQINPHYINQVQSGHNGETRAQRLKEFTCVDPAMPVIGIQEGSALWRQDNKLILLGDKEAYLFCGAQQEMPIPPGSDLSHMLTPQK